jgi:hypothetical protein
MKRSNNPRRSLLCLAGIIFFLLSSCFYSQALAAVGQDGGFDFSRKGFSFKNAGFSIWQAMETGKLGGRFSSQIYAGYQFAPRKDGYVTGLCGYFSGNEAVSLYDSHFNLLVSMPVASKEIWSCVPVSPVSLRQGENYYVAAEIDGGTMYYRYLAKDIFPASVHDIEIKAGVHQALWEPFGDDLAVDPRAVYGLVDIRFRGGALDRDVEDGAISGSTEEKSIIKNCAAGICVYCSKNSCYSKELNKDQSLLPYLETCANGICVSCNRSGCDSVKTDKWAGRGQFFIKNCVDGQCVNCFNGECSLSGAISALGQNLSCGGRFCETDKIAAGKRSYNSVWGGCAENSCGRGGIFLEHASGKFKQESIPYAPDIILAAGGMQIANGKTGDSYAVSCNDGVCDLCAAKKCVKIGVRLKEERVAIAAENDENPGQKQKKALAMKVASKNNDNQPPVISNLKPKGQIIGPPATLSCDTDEDSFCKLCVIDQPFPEMCQTFGETGGVHHSQSIGPITDGVYKYYVKCRDRAGNENPSSSQINFRVLTENSGSGSDLEPPVIASPLVFAGSDSTSLEIKAAVFDDNGIKEVKARISDVKGGTFAVVHLSDDGKNGDQAASDGFYFAKWLGGGQNLAKATAEIIAIDNSGNFSFVDAEIFGFGTDSAAKNTGVLKNDDYAKALVLDYTFENGKIFLNAISAGFAILTPASVGSTYLARLVGMDGEALGSYGLGLPWRDCSDSAFAGGNGGEMPVCSKDAVNLRINLPYRPEAKTIDIYDPDGRAIFSVPVTDLMSLCGNSVCERGENGGNCEKDCSFGAKDGYCGSITDGFCDPDCSDGADGDCGKGPKTFLAVLTAAAVMPILLVGIMAQKRSFSFRAKNRPLS